MATKTAAEKLAAKMAAKKGAKAEPELPYIPGDFEVEFTYPLLGGNIGMSYHEEGEEASRIVDTKDPLDIDITWCLEGSLVRYICGYWCVQVFLECYGDCAADFSVQPDLIELDPCGDGCYSTTVTIPPNTIKLKEGQCSCVCKVVVTITYLTKCLDETGHYKPGAIAGVVEGPVFQFYNMGEEEVP